MTAPARCTNCSTQFEVPDSLIGGITNCPTCGRATQVEGLRDPLWNFVCIAAGLLAIGVPGWLHHVEVLPLPGAICLGLGIGLVAWVVSRGM